MLFIGTTCREFDILHFIGTTCRTCEVNFDILHFIGTTCRTRHVLHWMNSTFLIATLNGTCDFSKTKWSWLKICMQNLPHYALLLLSAVASVLFLTVRCSLVFRTARSSWMRTSIRPGCSWAVRSAARACTSGAWASWPPGRAAPWLAHTWGSSPWRWVTTVQCGLVEQHHDRHIRGAVRHGGRSPLYSVGWQSSTMTGTYVGQFAMEVGHHCTVWANRRIGHHP